MQAIFQKHRHSGGIVSFDKFWETVLLTKDNFAIVPCFPLRSFLLALNKTTIDYFSLDIEGLEYKVLQSLPWHQINIKVSL